MAMYYLHLPHTDVVMKAPSVARPTPTLSVRYVSPVMEAFTNMLHAQGPKHLSSSLTALLATSQGTAGDGRDEQRATVLLNLVLRSWCPTLLGSVLPYLAQQLQDLPSTLTLADLNDLHDMVEEISARPVHTLVDDDEARTVAAEAICAPYWLAGAQAFQHNPLLQALWQAAQQILAMSVWAFWNQCTYEAFQLSGSFEQAEQDRWLTAFPLFELMWEDALKAVQEVATIR